MVSLRCMHAPFVRWNGCSCSPGSGKCRHEHLVAIINFWLSIMSRRVCYGRVFYEDIRRVISQWNMLLAWTWFLVYSHTGCVICCLLNIGCFWYASTGMLLLTWSSSQDLRNVPICWDWELFRQTEILSHSFFASSSFCIDAVRTVFLFLHFVNIIVSLMRVMWFVEVLCFYKSLLMTF
jgi:hypothetical protein